VIPRIVLQEQRRKVIPNPHGGIIGLCRPLCQPFGLEWWL
jgi:hypothetical protein